MGAVRSQLQPLRQPEKEKTTRGSEMSLLLVQPPSQNWYTLHSQSVAGRGTWKRMVGTGHPERPMSAAVCISVCACTWVSVRQPPDERFLAVRPKISGLLLSSCMTGIRCAPVLVREPSVHTTHPTSRCVPAHYGRIIVPSSARPSRRRRRATPWQRLEGDLGLIWGPLVIPEKHILRPIGGATASA